MRVFTVSFFGHRQICVSSNVEQKLEKVVRELILQKEYVEFLVGRDGEFDQLASSTILRCKHTIRNDNNSLIWIMPYLTAKYRNNEEAFNNYYDEIEVGSSLATGHYKSAFRIRNRNMVDRSDFVVFCVNHSFGGAYQTMCYAQKQGKQMINLTVEPH